MSHILQVRYVSLAISLQECPEARFFVLKERKYDPCSTRNIWETDAVDAVVSISDVLYFFFK